MDNVRVYASLSKDKGNDKGEYPIHLFVLLNNVLVSRVPTKVRVKAEHWDDKNKEINKKHTSAGPLNARILKQKTDLYNTLINKVTAHETLTKQDVRDIIKGKDTGDIIVFFRDFLNYVSSARRSKGEDKAKYADSNIEKWESEFNRLNKYTGGTLKLNKINTKWMEDYEAHCATYLDQHTSLPVTMSRLIQILTKAERKGLFDKKQISGYERPKYRNPERSYLTLKQTEKILTHLIEGKLNGTHSTIAAFFLVECYAGIRFSDWGRFTIEKIDQGRAIKATAKKTGAPLYIPIEQSPRLKQVINYITEHELHFDYTEQFTNRELKEIAKICKLELTFKLTTHVGRHTAATLLLEKGYTLEYIAEILGTSVKTVSIYAKITRAKLRNEYELRGGL